MCFFELQPNELLSWIGREIRVRAESERSIVREWKREKEESKRKIVREIHMKKKRELGWMVLG